MVRACAVIGILLPALLVGCGGGLDDDPETGSVSGTVTVDGKPVGSGYSILFQPTDGRPPQSIPLDDSGNFKGDAVVGENEVSIVPPAGGGGHDTKGAAGGSTGGINPNVLRSGGGAPQPLKFTVPDSGKSGLKVEVGATPSIG